MRLFRRKTNSVVDKPEPDSIGTRLGNVIAKLQTAFAERMNVAAAKIPTGKLKRNLAFFCLLSGGFSLYLAMNGMLGSSPATNVITIDNASVPKHFDKSGDEINEVQNIVDEDLYSQVKTFRSYVDSLQMNDKTVYDSIMLSRPGLMDSIRAIEEIYLSQQIK
jgi:hypothetical protein